MRSSQIQPRTARPRAKRRIVAALVASLALAGVIGIAPPAAPAQAATAAACTDNGSTGYEFTQWGVRVELRLSANCNGTAWFRMNNGVGSAGGNGTVMLQVRTATNAITTGNPTNLLAAKPFISGYATGYSAARLVYTNTNGAASSFVGPWVGIPGSARVAG
jgi:hypothetical protein